jgi:hypothetical protein
LNAWRRSWRRSFGYAEPIRRARARGLWPAAVPLPRSWKGRRVLVSRGDRFGDMMLTLGFLARARQSGADLRVLAADRLSRQLVSAAGIPCVGRAAALGDWRPEWVWLPEPCRHLRSLRHPERWSFVEEMLETFRGAAFAVPSMRRAEAMSVFPGPYCTPRSGLSAIGLLDRFADGLGLPPADRPLLRPWIAPPEQRRRGAIVLNLSAGRASESDRRDLPIGFWSEVADLLSGLAPLACIAQPGDEARRDEAASDPRLGKGEVVCFDDVAEAAAWLGSQRLLLSPETGLCHLARNLGVPMVVLTPPRKVPYFYPPARTSRFVFAKSLRRILPGEVVAEALGMLDRY